MIYGKIWCVVKPSVGVPLFLGGVALTSLIVHASVLTNTSWFPKFLNGNTTAKVVAAPASAPPGK